jgi:cell division protein FtsA
VVNIESTVQSIQRAVEEAELMSGCQIHSVYTGIAGSHIRSLNSHGIVAIKDQEVSKADVERVSDAAKAVAIPADQKILHILPQEFIIDNQDGIKEPIGMSGVRLEAKVHIITGAVSAAQNIIKCVEKCGLEVSDIILEQLASSYAVLTDDEKELGVCLIDIGGGTTEIAVIALSGIVCDQSIRIAGDEFTNDIVSYMKRQHNILIGERTAEQIKISVGSALHELDEDQAPEDFAAHGRDLMTGIPKQIKVGYREIAHSLDKSISKIEDAVLKALESTPPELAADIFRRGLYLTGGGALLRGLDKRISLKTKLPVQVADDPLRAVVRGTGIALKNTDRFTFLIDRKSV